jgi:hypothetical protein
MSKLDPERFSTDKSGIEQLGALDADAMKAFDEARAKREAHNKMIRDKAGEADE